MTAEPKPASTTPNLDELPRGLRLLLRLSVLVAGAGAAVVSFVVLLLSLAVLHKLGLDGAVANMLMLLLSPGVIVAGIVAARRVERFQERRLQASLVPPALEAATLSGTDTSTAVPASAALLVDVDSTKI
jgi:hypothetical protein